MIEVEDFVSGNVIVMWDGKWVGTYADMKEATQHIYEMFDGVPSHFEWKHDRDCLEFLEISQDQPDEEEHARLTFTGWGRNDQYGNRYSFGKRVKELPNPLLTMEQPIMKLGEYFEQAIKEADWQRVCNVYRQITGKYIEPPKPKQLVLADIDMSLFEQTDTLPPSPPPLPPAEQEMVDETNETWVEEESKGDEAQPEFIAPARQSEASPEDREKRMARREPIKIPKHRVNEWADDLTIAANELVTEHPELGVANPRPRGQAEHQTGNKILVVCSLCGKKEKVAPSLAVGWDAKPDLNTYKCNKCSTPKGRVELHRSKMNA